MSDELAYHNCRGYPRFFFPSDREICYMEMPGSVSTRIKRHFKVTNMVTTAPDEEVFTVMRDPVDRFVAGFLYLFRKGANRGCKTPTRMIERILRHGFWDVHIFPQSWFIHHSGLEEIDIYMLDTFAEMHDFDVSSATEKKLRQELSRAMPISTLNWVRYVYRDDYALWDTLIDEEFNQLGINEIV